MPFVLLTLNDSDAEKYEKLKHRLAGDPNGTPFCCKQRIITKHFKDKFRLYWIDDDEILSIKKCLQLPLLFQNVKILDEIKVSVRDADWVWDDDYIDSLFLNYI
jgi:hypothetical protein